MDFDRKNWRQEGLRKPDNIFLLLKKIFFKERKKTEKGNNASICDVAETAESM